MSNTKKFLSAIMAVLLVLSVSFFVFVSPTSAWLYQSVEVENGTFVFGDFDASQSYDDKPQDEEYEYGTEYNIKFKAATRFADADEILFDECIHVVHVTAKNQGALDAYAAADVEYRADNVGLRYCFLTTDEVIKDYKGAVEEMLESNSFSVKGYSNTDFQNAENVETAYEEYNETAKEVLDANNASKSVIKSKGQKELYVIFWIEYGELLAAYPDFDSSNISQLDNYSVKVTFNAAQEDYGVTPSVPATASLSVKNSFSDDNSVAVTRINVKFNSAAFVGSCTVIDASGASRTVEVTDGSLSLGNDECMVIDDCNVGDEYEITVGSVNGYTATTEKTSGTVSEYGVTASIVQTINGGVA